MNFTNRPQGETFRSVHIIHPGQRFVNHYFVKKAKGPEIVINCGFPVDAVIFARIS